MVLPPPVTDWIDRSGERSMISRPGFVSPPPTSSVIMYLLHAGFLTSIVPWPTAVNVCQSPESTCTMKRATPSAKVSTDQLLLSTAGDGLGQVGAHGCDWSSLTVSSFCGPYPDTSSRVSGLSHASWSIVVGLPPFWVMSTRRMPGSSLTVYTSCCTTATERAA